LNPCTKAGVELLCNLVRSKGKKSMVNGYNTAQSTVKTLKISVVNGKTTEKRCSNFGPAITAMNRESMGMTLDTRNYMINFCPHDNFTMFPSFTLCLLLLNFKRTIS